MNLKPSCDDCGKIIHKTPYQLNNSEHHFCSKKCYGDWVRKTGARNGKNNPQFKKIPWNKGLTKDVDERILRYAKSVKDAHRLGKMSKAYRSISNSLKQSYSKGKIVPWNKGKTKENDPRIAVFSERVSCTLRGKYPGEKNPNWKGGYEPYYGPNWEEQKRRALERDSYTCRNCDSKERVEVNHIIPFRNFGRARYLEANKLENLIVLCIHCHRRFEGKIEYFKELVAVIPCTK